MADHELPQILFSGQIEVDESILGVKVKFKFFSAGVEEDIRVRVSGLDDEAKVYVKAHLTLAHAIVSINGYGFGGGKFEEKLEVIRRMDPDVRDLFHESFSNHKARLRKRILELNEKMGKSSPEPT